jgi:hypothetical protein
MQIGQSAIGAPARPSKLTIVWLLGLIAMFIVAGFMSLFEKTTLIAPSQDGINNVSMYTAIAVALASAIAAFLQLPGRRIAKRIMAAAAFALLGFGGSAFLLMEVADYIQDWIYFPAGKTRTVQEAIPIWYAYHHTSRYGSYWTIDLPDALIDIAPSDAEFLLKHRLSGDTSGSLGQIWSGNYFCANVKVETAGDAKRIMRMNSGLPPGSVSICPNAKLPGPRP